jgi:hypothetical protein
MLFADVPPPKKPHRKRSTLFAYLEECNTKIEEADKVVLADFMTLQSVWRRQDTLRSTFERMPSSREEREAWKHLIQYLTRLPAPED